MTNKIEQGMLDAIRNKHSFTSNNTTVNCYQSFRHAVIDVLLSGHPIATINGSEWDPKRRLKICLCGHNTRATRSRLNAILSLINAHIHIEKGIAILTYPDGKREEMSSVCNYYLTWEGDKL